MALKRCISLVAVAMVTAGSAFACDTIEDVVRGTHGQLSKVTVISEERALSRALSFMLGHADEVQSAETLIVIERGADAEVVLIQSGCATLKALSSRDLIVELLRRARGEDEGKGELI